MTADDMPDGFTGLPVCASPKKPPEPDFAALMKQTRVRLSGKNNMDAAKLLVKAAFAAGQRAENSALSREIDELKEYIEDMWLEAKEEYD